MVFWIQCLSVCSRCSPGFDSWKFQKFFPLGYKVVENKRKEKEPVMKKLHDLASP